MSKKIKTVIAKPVIQENAYDRFEIRDEKALDKIFASYSDNKVSFAKIVFSGARGPYIVAFEDSITRDYCECNALDFKSVNVNDIKFEEVPIWCAGSKTPEEINALPKLNIKKYKADKVKAKEEKKTAQVAKRVTTRKKKK